MSRTRLSAPNADLDVRIAANRRDFVGAFELVYFAYLTKGYIRPQPGRMVYQSVFGLPTSRTMVAAAPGDNVAGTLSIVGDNRFGFQLETTYRDEVQLLRDEGRKLAEITCLTIENAGGFRPTEVFAALTRFTIQYAIWRGYDDLLMAVHPRHYRFYWRIFRAAPLGPPRAHEVVEGNLALCCRIDLVNLKRNMAPEMSRQYFSGENRETQFLLPPITPTDHQYCCNRAGVSSDLGANVFSVPDRDAA
jgi:N-acyl amino acid synthase FeeM